MHGREGGIMVKVSVIVPIYNNERYLRECLDSIVNQTLKDIEIICIDDGSTDNSSNIVDEYALKDSRIKVIHKKNEGLGKAYNLGMSLADGEYIGMVESDDFAELNMFENLYNLAKSNDADIVKGNFFFYTSSPLCNYVSNDIKNEWIDKITNIKEFGEILTIPSQLFWAALYRKDFIYKHNIRFLETPGASYQDVSFAFKTTALAERIFLTSKPYIHYRVDNPFQSVQSKGKVYCVCDEYHELQKFINDYPQLKEYTEQYKWINQYTGYIWNLNRISEEYWLEFIEEFSKQFRQAYQDKILSAKFYEKINKQEFSLLINSPKKFYNKLMMLKKWQRFQEKRRKIITGKLGWKTLRISVLGRILINIG